MPKHNKFIELDEDDIVAVCEPGEDTVPFSRRNLRAQLPLPSVRRESTRSILPPPMPPPVAAARRERRPSYVESPFARRLSSAGQGETRQGETSQLFSQTQLAAGGRATSLTYSEPPPPVVMSAAPPPVHRAPLRSDSAASERRPGRRVPAFVSSLALMAVGAGLAVACFAAFERRFGSEAQAPAAVAAPPVVAQPVSVPVVSPVIAAPAIVSPAPPAGPSPMLTGTPAQSASLAAAPKRGQVINFGAADGLKVDATPAPSPVRRTFVRRADKPKPETPSDVLASALGTAASPEPPPPPPPVAETPLAVQLAPDAPIAPAKAKSAADALAEAQLRAPMK